MIRIHSRMAYTRTRVILLVFLCNMVANLLAAMAGVLFFDMYKERFTWNMRLEPKQVLQ